jgi:site-specific recombinase XerD
MPSAALYIRENSPYYWLSVYDKHERDSKKKRKKLSTGIEITNADLKRYNEWKKSGSPLNKKPKLLGNEKTRRLIAGIKQGQLEEDLFRKTGVKIRKKKLLSDAFEDFKRERSIKDHPKHLKPKTLKNYSTAVQHFISCNTDKEVYKYTYKNDYFEFLRYMEDEDFAQNSKSIYTRTLKSLWNYFVEEELTEENIIRKIDEEIIGSDPIDLDDMNILLKYYYKKDIKKYHAIAYLLLSFCRPSTAMVQEVNQIDFKEKIIWMKNVKARKKVKYYPFPLYKSLESLVRGILEYHEGGDRLFSHFPIGNNYTDAFRWWYRDNLKMFEAGLIRKRYQLQQLRETAPSYALNVLGMDIFTIQKLLDHSNIRITDKHYVKVEMKKARKVLDEFRIDIE